MKLSVVTVAVSIWNLHRLRREYLVGAPALLAILLTLLCRLETLSRCFQRAMPNDQAARERRSSVDVVRIAMLQSGRPIGDWPVLGGPHKNGDRILGTYHAYASDLIVAGTPTVSSLARKSITPLIPDVRIGDELHVEYVDKQWRVTDDGRLIGMLTWGNGAVVWNGVEYEHPGAGTLHVERVFENSGAIVNLGGYVTAD